MIEVIGVYKEYRSLYRKVIALKNINLKIGDGEFFVILGPSGCGKSTLLNILAGLEHPSAGEICINDRMVVSTDKRIFLSPRERNVAMVFQSYALYPHLNVFENIAFPLRLAKFADSEIKLKVKEVANLLDIEPLLLARPKELSGGQKQRVAIARAIVRRPTTFLLDEPLSNLDAQLRVRMRSEIKNLQRRLGITTIYVTHDQVEAMTLGNRIAILKDGELQQVGEPMEIYNKPINTFVATFIGTPPMNLIEANIVYDADKPFITFDDVKIEVGKLKEIVGADSSLREVIVGIRPCDVGVQNFDSLQRDGIIEKEIKFIENLGAEVILYFELAGKNFLVQTQVTKFNEGDRVRLNFKPDSIHIFDKTGKNLMVDFYNNKG